MFGDLANAPPHVLEVEGTLPDWLRGTYVRNGPARFGFPGDASVRHWFDGMAYLQRFAFEDGRIAFNARFVESRAYGAALKGRRPFDAFGTLAEFSPRNLFGRPLGATLTDNPNVNVARYGEAFVALTEVGLPRCFDPLTLETSNEFRFDDGIGTGYTTAHPVYANGSWINYTLKFGPVNRYLIWSMNERGARTVLASISAPRASYVHSIGLSRRYAILVEFPYTANALAIAFSGKPFIENFHWNGAAPSRFHLVDLSGERPVRTCEGEAFFCFHHVHAFDDGDDVVVDLVGYDDATVVADLSIERLRAGNGVRTPGIGIRRYRVSPQRGTAERERIAPEPMRVELPRVNTRVDGRARYYYAPRFSNDAFTSEALVRVDVENGSTATWSHPGDAPAEAIFVGRPGASAENDGVLLTVVHSAAQSESALVVLDASTFEECARARTGVPLPLGFHGQFFRST